MVLAIRARSSSVCGTTPECHSPHPGWRAFPGGLCCGLADRCWPSKTKHGVGGFRLGGSRPRQGRYAVAVAPPITGTG